MPNDLYRSVHDALKVKAELALRVAKRSLGSQGSDADVEDLALSLMDLSDKELADRAIHPGAIAPADLFPDWRDGLWKAPPDSKTALLKAAEAVAAGLPWVNLHMDARAGYNRHGPFVEIFLAHDFSVEATVVKNVVLRVRPVLRRSREAEDDVSEVTAGLDDAGIVGAMSSIVGRRRELSNWAFFARSPDKEITIPLAGGKKLLVAPDDKVWFNPMETSVRADDGSTDWIPLADPEGVWGLAKWRMVEKSFSPPK